MARQPRFAVDFHRLFDASQGGIPPRPTQPGIEAALRDAAQESGTPYELVRAVAWVESRDDPGHRSADGREGLMGMTLELARTLGCNRWNVLASAIFAATVLRRYFEHFQSWELAIAAYYWGAGRVATCPQGELWPSALQRYVVNVWLAAGWKVPTPNEVLVTQRVPT
jgi:soluble lytic murein transglycosylase-like protein